MMGRGSVVGLSATLLLLASTCARFIKAHDLHSHNAHVLARSHDFSKPKTLVARQKGGVYAVEADAEATFGRDSPDEDRHGRHGRGSRKHRRSHITRKDGRLISDGKTFRFASLNAPDLVSGDDDFEVEDTMRTLAELGAAVTRTYTLSILGTSPHLAQEKAHIRGWDARKRDWIYDEGMFKKLDAVIALAGEYDVRLIFPFINQDFGTVETNWVGNFVDLIIHRKNSGWDYATARKNVDVFTDRTMIDSFKQVITYILNRRNTVNGIRYGDDPAILAWETGNELNRKTEARESNPPPGAWTVEIARHIKSLAPRTLVSDGTYGRNLSIKETFAIEALQSKYVDIFDGHYYTEEELKRITAESDYIRSFGKAFIVGEYGFISSANSVKNVLKAAEKSSCSGTLIWSFRPHSADSGFKTKREDENHAAYHAPGWPNPSTPSSWKAPEDWDTKEHGIMSAIYDSSFSINRLRRPRGYPVPDAPTVWLKEGVRSIAWQGAAWANNYEIWVSRAPQQEKKGSTGGRIRQKWARLATGVLDAVDAGTVAFPLPADAKGALRIRGVSLDGRPGEWSNTIKI